MLDGRSVHSKLIAYVYVQISISNKSRNTYGDSLTAQKAPDELVLNTAHTWCAST